MLRIYLGALHSYALVELVDPGAKLGFGSREKPEAFVESVVAVLWTGLAPTSKKARRS